MGTVPGNCFFNINFDWKKAIIAFLFSSLLVGCASVGGTYSEDEGDICANQRGELRRTEDYFVKQGVTNVVGGAAIGAASGAIISAISGGDVGQGAAIGAAAGAGAGLLKTLFESINRDNQQIDMATNAFTNLSQCRFSASEVVRSDFRAGRTTKPDALKKLSDLKIRYNEDIVIAQRIGAKISERSKEFENNLVKEDPSVAPYLAAVRTEQTTIDNLKDTSQPSTELETSTKDIPKQKGSVSKYKKTSKSKYSSTQSTASAQKQAALANKEAAKAKIKTADAKQAAVGSETNIVKAHQYNKTIDTAKSTELNKKFELESEGQIGLFLFPNTNEPYLISWLEGQNKQCSVLF